MSEFRINCMKVQDIKPLTGADYKISLSLQMTDWQKREAAAQLLGAMPTDKVEQLLRAKFAELFDDAQAPVAQQLPTKNALADIIAAGLRDTYHCTRVWSAWSYGTMGPDDFSPADESDTPAELADAILAALAAPVPVARCPHCDDTGDVHAPTGEWRGRCACEATPAPVAQPAGEPVAWQYRFVRDDGQWSAWVGCERDYTERHKNSILIQVRALYTVPPAAARVPMTPAQ